MHAKTIAEKIIACFERGNKLILIGNGGSSTQASHFAAEFINRYKKYRKPLPAIALNDPAILTSISNDSDYMFVFARPVQALGNEGDMLVTLSTSGNSDNVNYASNLAIDNGLEILDWPRKGKDVGDIQNKQLVLMHKVCELVENYYADN